MTFHPVYKCAFTTHVCVKTLAPKISSCERRARVTGEFSEVLCMLEGLTQAFFDIFFEVCDILENVQRFVSYVYTNFIYA